MISPELIKINYAAFEPLTIEKRKIEWVAFKLLQRTPSDSTMTISFSENDGNLTCRCSVKASKRHLISSHVGKDFIQTFKECVTSIDRELDFWRKNRFHRETA